MEEEVQLFLRRLAKLEGLLKELYMKCTSADEGNLLLATLKKCATISEAVSVERSLNAGGRFEWVNSVLVKCLQEGSWLLVDNVNLCSAAVLDRLNALLEPNGVLTISERGADKEGKMFEVVPHKDFRIFLTMDPKNGEISRAMRNRGVEIYILDDKESTTTNDFDLKSLIEFSGLSNPRHISALLKTHDFVSSLILSEKPKHLELLRCASLISEQLRKGIHVSEAFHNTCTEVYYKTRNSSEFNCNNVLEVLKEGVLRCLDEHELIELYSRNVTVNTRDLVRWSSLEKVKHQCAIFENSLSHFNSLVEAAKKVESAAVAGPAYKQSSKHTTDLTIWADLESVRKQNEFFEKINFYTLANLLAIVYSLSSKEDLEWRTLYLQERIGHQEEWRNSLEKFKKVVESFAPNHNPYMPLDSWWINDDPLNYQVSNPINLIFQTEIYRLKDVFEVKFSPKNSFFNYLVALKTKSVSEVFRSSICSNYIALRQEHSIFIKTLFKYFAANYAAEDKFVKVLELLSWRQALHSFFTCVSLPKKNFKADRLDTLAVYYKWFYKYAVQAVVQLLDTQIPSSLDAILQTVNRDVEEHFSDIYKTGKAYQRLNDKPECFRHEWQLEAMDLLDRYDVTDPKIDPIANAKAFKSNQELRKHLTQLKMDIYLDKEHNEELTLVKAGVENSSSKVSLKFHDTQVLPLVDVLSQTLLLNILKNIASGNNIQTDSLNNDVLVPVELHAALLSFKQTGDCKLLHEIKKQFYLYAMSSASVKFERFLMDSTESEGVGLVAGLQPAFTLLLVKLLVPLEGKMATTLSNFRGVEYQQRVIGNLMWSNMFSMAQEQFDFEQLQLSLVKSSVEIFLNRLQKALNADLTSSDPKLKHVLPQILDTYENLQIDLPDNTLSHIADLHMMLGYCEAYLNALLPPVDPLAKKAMKKNHILSIIGMFEQMKTSFQLQNTLFSNEERCRHPYYAALEKAIKTLRTKVEKYGKTGTIGYKVYPYSYVVQQIKYAFQTVIDSSLLQDTSQCTTLINTLETSHSDSVLAKIQSHIDRIVSTIPSYERIFHDWKIYRSSYPDIVEPLLSNISQFLYGLKIKLFWMQREMIKWTNKADFNADLEEEIEHLAAFPSLNHRFGGVNELVDNYTRGRMGRLLEGALGDDLKGTDKLRVLKSGIQECFNQCVVNAKATEFLDKCLLSKFDQLVEAFVQQWNLQQEKKEKEKSEAESIYKIQVKCDDKPEEEQAQDELNSLFPNYHVLDFADLQEKSLDSSEEPPKAQDLVDAVSQEDLRFVIDLHSRLYQRFVKSEWIEPELSKDELVDHVGPLMEKLQLVRKAMDRYGRNFKYTLDSKLVGSLSVLLEVRRRYGGKAEHREASSPTKKGHQKDFYRDSDVEEVKTCYHVLEELRGKVKQLLQEWPDQPTLLTILTVIDRILNFDITSPISRFLTGFDILLAKCYEWEQVAHSGVSLIEITPNLIAQIITWRKLELSRWKEMLNTTHDDLKKPLSKWWLYMYNLINQYTVEQKVSQADLIDTLQKFITKSSLVEFPGRLQLLYEFHCRAVTLPRTAQSEEFKNVLWNLYNYFEQFSTTVATKLRELRAPIEKKLKDYVKIVKWKDISYWSVKDTVDKSHKILHKLVREYKDVLVQPVTSYLVNQASDSQPETVGIWDRPQRQNKKAYHYTLDAESYIVKASNKELPYLNKARKICKETIGRTKYPELVKSLDTFVGDVIETSGHLRNLEVDTTQTKEKQKSQAKGILQQKHRALADLFQNLSKMGLSYKTGLMDVKLKEATEDFTIKPVDLTVSFGCFGHNSLDAKILTIWDSCEVYYYKSLMRFDVLERALVTPAQDLGMHNVERCRGFGAHLLAFCQVQKRSLIHTTRSHYYLRSYARQLRELAATTVFVSSTVVDDIKRALNSLSIVVGQLTLILDSCPEETSFGEELVEIPVLEPGVRKLRFKNDEFWKEATKSIGIINSLTAKIHIAVQKSELAVPAVERELVQLKVVPFDHKDQVLEDLGVLSAVLHKLEGIFEPVKFVESLTWLQQRIAQILDQLRKTDALEKDNVSDNWKPKLDEFTTAMLLVFQNLYKKYRDSKEENDNEEEEGVGIQENHLKQLIMNSLSTDVVALDLDKLTKMAEQVMTLEAQENEDFKVSLTSVLPLLDQVLHLSQYFITQQVAAYRTTCKLTSILLNIFIDLASKGFCIPPELSAELDKEGMSKPSDGLGLGEGQGERDVSDKIESEDQLDDAQPAGLEKEQNEDPDCNEEDKGIEMSEDFDSKLQDKKPQDEDDDKENSDSDAEEQMGDTEKGADQLDQQIWGDDKEEDRDAEEEEGEQKEEEGTGGEKEGEDQLGAKDDNKPKDKDKSKNKEPVDDQEGESEKNQKEINEMNEPEFDDEQTDPYHGNQHELPEPEPMDLPDDLQLDDGEENDKETPEENPFDIDEMKEQQIPENKPDDDGDSKRDDTKENDEAQEFSSDDEDVTNKDDKGDEEDKEPVEANDGEDDSEEKEPQQGEEDNEADSANDNDDSALDQNATNQENVEAMEVDDADATDKTQATESENLKSDQPIDETCQEDKPDKEGVGQSQMEESESGHSVQSTVPQNAKSSQSEEEQREQKKKEKPGESDSKRSLGDVKQPVQKKLKTMDAKNDQDVPEGEDSEEQAAEMYQHIKEAKKEAKTQVLDAATKEQAEEQSKEATHKEDEENHDQEEGAQDVPDEEEPMDVDVGEDQAEKKVKTDKTNKDKQKNVKQHPEGDVMEDIQEIDVEGDIVKTSTVPRGEESSHHTQFHLLQETGAARLTQEEINTVRTEVETQLSSWKSAPSSSEAENAWQKMSSVTSGLAQHLSEQLRLVLEPTQASHLKGDFRTGRRINMRKIIPYIASQFRKDKIWLRRTKPSKREYQIVLAIDDSSSMADNHSKELAFESVALISKALSLLESGQLAVVSFGETTEIHHKLQDPFTDSSGVQLLQNFKFDQQKTCVGKLVDFVTEMFEQSNVQASIPNAKLLLIVSDGRGVFSEGKTYVTQAVRRAKLSNVFTVFVIIDSPENKNSILDIRSTVFEGGKFLGMKNYMDEFPFAFYIILRDINSLPGVLSDALMQWFEMVTSQQ